MTPAASRSVWTHPGTLAGMAGMAGIAACPRAVPGRSLVLSAPDRSVHPDVSTVWAVMALPASRLQVSINVDGWSARVYKTFHIQYRRELSVSAGQA
jgi:hypothetical protein